MLYYSFSPIFVKGERYYALSFASILKRYKEAFGPFKIIARRSEWSDKLPLVDVTDCFSEVFLLQSRLDIFFPSKGTIGRIKDMVASSNLICIRIPALGANLIFKIAKKYKLPVMSEVMGCPWDMFWNHSFKGKIIAPFITLSTKNLAKNSDYVHYVTENFLQQRYPSASGVPVCAASDVKIKEISDDTIGSRRKKIKNMDRNSITVMTSAAVDVRYKGQQYMIEAISILAKRGINARYIIAGGGNPNYLLHYAQKYNVADRIRLTGRLSADDIVKNLDECDIYVQPSLQEGLPRALVEALSRGCPAVGAHTGGIPELLPPQCVVKRKSAKAIADAIEKMLNDGLEKYSESSFRRARDFEVKELEARFNSFYNNIKQNL